MIDAKNLKYKELNEQIKTTISSGSVELINVDGQRYIGIGLKQGRITINGVPGNDLGMFLDGADIFVSGDAEDGVGNTMNKGSIVINGSAEDIVGYAMRGGSICINGNTGYRVGVCMKANEQSIPMIVVRGNTQDFLGEYMSGGRIIVLGKVGNYVGTGMHGGIIFVKGKVDRSQLGYGAVIEPLTDWDNNEINRCLSMFCKSLNLDLAELRAGEFTKIVPLTHRPYSEAYCSRN
jgi:glutamate synthase domain-containing protein 3